MPRRREVPKRKILPDPKFHDRTIAKFCNVVMKQGKKSPFISFIWKTIN
jgi:small subunit ribosomal protein S7